jgi:hypothetical protein
MSDYSSPLPLNTWSVNCSSLPSSSRRGGVNGRRRTVGPTTSGARAGLALPAVAGTETSIAVIGSWLLEGQGLEERNIMKSGRARCQWDAQGVHFSRWLTTPILHG